jgi:hypothetical protein
MSTVLKAGQTPPGQGGDVVGLRPGDLRRNVLLGTILGKGSNISPDIQAAKDFSSLAATVIDHLSKIFSPDFSAIIVKHPSGEFGLLQGENIDEASLGLKDPDDLFSEVLKRRQTQIIEPASKFPIIQRTGVKLIVMSPVILLRRAELLGVLAVGKNRPWSPKDEQVYFDALTTYGVEILPEKVNELLAKGFSF